jgi:hypothetical protein
MALKGKAGWRLNGDFSHYLYKDKRNSWGFQAPWTTTFYSSTRGSSEHQNLIDNLAADIHAPKKIIQTE